MELLLFLFMLFFVLLLLNPLFWLLFLPLFVVFLLAVFYFVSLELLIFSLINLVLIPKQLWHMFRNPVLRKNHALEHATINVLEERYGKLPATGGFADPKGFFIYTKDPVVGPDDILSAAGEGLMRLKRGEKDLAIHERCGTSITVTNLLLSILFLAVLFFGDMFDLWHVLGALVLSFIASRPLGRLAQRYITTDPNVSDMMIVGIRFEPFTRYMGIPLPVGPLKFFVETKPIPKATRIL